MYEEMNARFANKEERVLPPKGVPLDLFDDNKNDNFRVPSCLKGIIPCARRDSFESEIAEAGEEPPLNHLTDDEANDLGARPGEGEDLMPMAFRKKSIDHLKEPRGASPVASPREPGSMVQKRSLSSAPKLVKEPTGPLETVAKKTPIWKRIDFPLNTEELNLNERLMTVWGYVTMFFVVLGSFIAEVCRFLATWLPVIGDSLMKILRRVEFIDATVPTSEEWSQLLSNFVNCYLKEKCLKLYNICEFLVLLLWCIFKNFVSFIVISVLWAVYMILQTVSNVFMSRTLAAVARLVHSPLSDKNTVYGTAALASVNSASLIFYHLPRGLLSILCVPMSLVANLPSDGNLLKTSVYKIRQEIAEALFGVQRFAVFARTIVVDIHEFVTMILFLIWMFAEISINLCSYLMLVSQAFQMLLWFSGLFSSSILQLNGLMSLAQKKKRPEI